MLHFITILHFMTALHFMHTLRPTMGVAWWAAGRRLTWQTNMGNADIKANFGGKKHELNCTTYQVSCCLSRQHQLLLGDTSCWGVPVQ